MMVHKGAKSGCADLECIAGERLGIIYHMPVCQKSTHILGVMLRVLTPSGFLSSN